MLVMDRQVAEFWRSTASNNNGVSTSVSTGTSVGPSPQLDSVNRLQVQRK